MHMDSLFGYLCNALPMRGILMRGYFIASSSLTLQEA